MIRPIQDRVLLEKLDVQMPGSGLLALPETAKERPVVRCRVVAAGPRAHVKAGDVAWLNQYDQTVIDVEHEGVRLMMVRDGDLLAVAEP